MSGVKICSSCQHSNPIESTICEKCESPLVALLPARSTVPVPPNLRENLGKIAEAPRPPHRFDDALRLFVVGHEEPILTETEHRQITLGRVSPGESAPSVDVTPYDAVLLGVSRLHAILHRSSNGCYIQDLNSTNGTYLNERRIAPHKLFQVNSGDTIALGQLGLRVFFETSQSEYTIDLVDETAPGQRLTPAYLESRVSQYMLALGKAQQLIDAMLERPISGVTIHSIEMRADGIISVSLIGARDVLRLIETGFAEWRQARLIIVERLRALNQEAKAKADPADRDVIKAKSDPLVKEVRTQLGAFAQSWIEASASLLPADKHQEHREKLVPVLQTLLFSPLQPAVSLGQAETEA
ncbi:MAG: FHA domain-containing protein, partial [Anaerolineae bacterium]|nr:FHA domain-containing protein [Anaerolineae bacterium]